jgi:hypothetical protein
VVHFLLIRQNKFDELLVTPTAKILIGNINGASNVQAANSMAQKNFSALVWW